jgi:REP element-mobilizing transposase RayT
MIPHRPRNRVVIAHHLVLMGYGHWLPNDLRGSGSDEIRKELLAELGEIHPGRKQQQPPRCELKTFHSQAKPLLEHEIIWFNEAMRSVIADSFARSAAQFGYRVWACAVLRNHAHLIVQRHKHPHEVIWRTLAEGSRQSLRVVADLSDRHRVWGERPYSKFLYTPGDIRGGIKYVNENPEKDDLPLQDWKFVVPYPVGY